MSSKKSVFMQSLCESIVKETGGEAVRYDIETGKQEVTAQYKVENFPYATARRRVVKVDITGKNMLHKSNNNTTKQPVSKK